MADPGKRLAVLIDGENMPAKYADAIFDEIARFGTASIRRVYGDLEQGAVRPWLDMLSPLAIAPLHQPKNTVGKNASDIALVIDAMDILHGGRHDGFVLVSSDSDFTKLAQRIREHGLDVIGVGEKKTPESFRVACKQFVTVENLMTAPSTVSSDLAEVSPEPPSEKPMDLNRAYQLICNVIPSTNDPNGWAGMAWLGDQLTQRYPDFDSRSFGYKRLTDLVRAINKFVEKDTESGLHVREKLGLEG